MSLEEGMSFGCVHALACPWLLHAIGSIVMRFAIRLIVPLTAVALVACTGNDEAAAPVPVAQRFLTAADAPGTKPDPVETRETSEELDEFIATFWSDAADSYSEEMTTVFQEAGFKWAALDARFFGETHTPTARHVFSAIVELQSEDGASSVLDSLEADSMKPCPKSCAVQFSSFTVDDIAGARGVHRSATAEDIESFGTEDQHPFDSYWVGFTEGSIVYTVELNGPPGSVSEDQAQTIANAYFDRLSSV